jgi:hypothetical protein
MEYSKRMEEEQLNHVSGDRRLDGTDIIQTTSEQQILYLIK